MNVEFRIMGISLIVYNFDRIRIDIFAFHPPSLFLLHLFYILFIDEPGIGEMFPYDLFLFITQFLLENPVYILDVSIFIYPIYSVR